MTDEQIERVSEVASNWWADVIQHPKFDGGSDSAEMVMAQIMANNLTRPLAPIEVDLFKDVLKQLIKTGVEHMAHVSINCDYAPCDILSYAAEQSGIPLQNFPWKTHMWITDGRISVQYGYTDSVHLLEV